MLRCWWTYFSVKRPLRLALCSKWHPWRHIPPCSHFASWLWLYLAELVPKIIFVIICRLGWWRRENTSHTLGPDVPQHWRLLHSNLCQTELGSDILTIFSSISIYAIFLWVFRNVKLPICACAAQQFKLVDFYFHLLNLWHQPGRII